MLLRSLCTPSFPYKLVVCKKIEVDKLNVLILQQSNITCTEYIYNIEINYCWLMPKLSNYCFLSQRHLHNIPIIFILFISTYDIHNYIWRHMFSMFPFYVTYNLIFRIPYDCFPILHFIIHIIYSILLQLFHFVFFVP